MKTILLKTALVSLLVGTTFAVAGPGPQFWQNSNKTSSAAPGASVAKSDAGSPAVCGGCKTEAVREFVSTLPNGKGTPRWTAVGTKHTCGGCAGAIATIRGRVTDTMDRSASACARSAMVCCN
ncbi:MAG TPA: hypothetical protein VHD62_04655 [Opitutaceae bacterium]|nr:hypothetical protein [Opitutaceae bacterium]